jgi:predicted DNA-binding transcriptional regulator AlpA
LTAHVQQSSVLLDVKAVASRLGCTPRHVWRMRDRGVLPPAVQLGWLVRWNSESIEEWIRRGCPPHRQQKTRVRRARPPHRAKGVRT